jgi:hypothetical protein
MKSMCLISTYTLSLQVKEQLVSFVVAPIVYFDSELCYAA